MKWENTGSPGTFTMKQVAFFSFFIFSEGNICAVLLGYDLQMTEMSACKHECALSNNFS